MTTFDLAAVRDFTADISTRMNGCEIDEGTDARTLDAITPAPRRRLPRIL